MTFPIVGTAREVRDHIIKALRQELIGPSPGYPLVQLNGEEILRPQDPPRYRYSAGILFPMGLVFSSVLAATEEAPDLEATEPVGEEGIGGEADAYGMQDQTEIEGAAIEDKAPDTDIEVDPTSSFLPSTMGLSFLADVSGGIRIHASWGTYVRQPVPGFPSFRADGTTPELWFRTPGNATIDLAPGDLAGQDVILRPPPRRISPIEVSGCLEMHVVSRPRGGNLRLVTVTLVNSGRITRPINEHCFFQCSLWATPLGASGFRPYPGRPAALQDEEERSLALLYRHRPTYAVGHGCAADWKVADAVVRSVRTETLPVFEQAPIVPRDQVDRVELSMRGLAEATTADLAASCRALASAYLTWIDEREKELADETNLAPELRARGTDHLEDCRGCHARIMAGIDLLETDDDALEAFRLMNRAMLEQRAHYALSSDDANRRSWRKGANGQEPSAPCPAPDYGYDTRWRPFQLAFILMNVRSFVEPTHPERTLVDVIWFPTGGGKTEAYLGLAAFAILLRRLRNPDDAGTTVIMRYTLRLLTTQQFQRAASLICALEKRRRAEPGRFGAVPVSIGLWLGSGVTPNSDADAVERLGRLAHDSSDNPFIILSCPWCGVDMGPRDYDGATRLFGYRREKKKGGSQRVRFRCEDPGCEFSTEEGLPLEVVDQGIYAQPPALLIGTVDKFAIMPWNPESRVLFGIDHPSAASPPELIIQDELHLISGPLGSMVGHYETLIDEFSTAVREGVHVPAKIVASTATIARSAEQIRATYGRDSALFPPQGLVAGESFFAREGSEASGRLYAGVLATAVPSHVTAQVRTLATLLQAPVLPQSSGANLDEIVDPYWTLMVYFNSLRELGRASTLVQADIREYLNAVWDRTGIPVAREIFDTELRRFINNFEELTSRMRSSDIPAVLRKLFTAKPSRDVVDLCYATNMIQVGLDVPRLSLMSIVGQPKSASEYIQASSRVGRSAEKPGLVVTNYNPFKPRDRSHFEAFRSFHENAYRHVEPTSVTPFAIPVCERAIHALAVTFVRFRYQHLRDKPTAGLTPGEREEVTRLVMSRVALVDPAETGRAQATLDRFLDDWNRRKPQDYGSMARIPDDPLMFAAGRNLPPHLNHLAGFIRPTATSMRSVDADCEAIPIPMYLAEDDS